MGDDSEFSSAQAGAQKKYRGSIYTSAEYLPDEFAQGIQDIQDGLDVTVLMLIQNSSNEWYDWISPMVYKEFFDRRNNFPDKKPIALLLRSAGGDPTCAYKLANLFIKRWGGFITLIPDYAKSAATLLTLGSNRIVLGTYAELGPIDMQVPDEEKIMYQSALNHVQALERLGAYSKTTLDEAIRMFQHKTGKRTAAVLSPAIEYTASIVRPLMEKFDVVKYSEMSRSLKVGEDYAKRLLYQNYGQDAGKIASVLVSSYPEHGFVIDAIEAKAIGLKIELPTGKISQAFSNILPFIDNLTVLGSLQEVQENGENTDKN